MKILRISGKNLASLAGEFAVDFEAEPLASSGLFAICGPTGAGKSTLLDALCLALYGTTPRLPRNARGASALPDVGGEAVSTVDPRNLLRRGAGEGYAEVDFVGSDGLRYRARWSVRRSRNKPGRPLQASGMTLHRLPELAPLGGTKSEVATEIVQRVGLSFEQFTRAVLLAQNEFSAFLKADENERGELLETLTGSDVYSDISRRAFERYKQEQEALRDLTRSMAQQVPMPAEQRAALDTEREKADQALAEADARKSALEEQLRWHEELDKLLRSEAGAQAALAAANEQVAGLAARRLRLATLEAVQPARSLVADAARLARELAAAQAAQEAAQQELARAQQAHDRASAQLVTATQALSAAEAAQRDAAPLLDQAKALDAALATLEPAYRQAAAALEASRREASAAQAALQAKEAQLAQARTARQAAADWLARHARHEPLAAQWPRWERLLAQAGQALQADAADAAALQAKGLALEQAQEREAQATLVAEQAAGLVRTLEDERQRAIAALAAFDTDGLRLARHALEERRERLAAAEKTWAALATARERESQLRQQTALAQDAKVQAQEAFTREAARAEPLAAGAQQAERSLAAAELACADSVEHLRAGLADGEPCPVCGSTDHPYQQQDQRLRAMLANLRAELDRCQREVRENVAAQATHRAAAAAAGERLAELEREGTHVAATLAALGEQWQSHPLVQEAPAEEERGEWLRGELERHRDAAAALDGREKAALAAAQQRDAAQQACDKASANHVKAQEAATAARAASARLQAEHSALAAKRDAAGANLAACLAELDTVLSQADSDGWQRAWRTGPAAYVTGRANEARAWSAQSEEQARLSAAIATLEAELAGAASRAGHAQRIAEGASTEFTRVDADVGAKRQQRAQLLEGRPVQEVERSLSAAVTEARARLSQQQDATAHAAQAVVRANETIAQCGERCSSLEAAVAAATENLSAWLASYAEEHPALEPVDGKDALCALLDLGHDHVAQEREALAVIDARAASAATVLAERRGQRELHLQRRPAQALDDAAAARAALEQHNAERARLHETATALRVQARQDDERRQQGQALLAEIEKQQAAEQRWGKLSDLIGSADGKKFRNYAQQFTLDVLLGYANRHLSQLARRYRLERVVHQHGPSLALMVRDNDMGGEVRPVNSLSGGESFLVSLALALGLASLSSNRVRVESLFIDEGFGSLDSDTLGVAMDALDALQSQGRKVGVISHVQEMTERIATRIMVRPAGGGASAVSVQ